MNPDVQYEYSGGMVRFSNGVSVSEDVMDALFKLKLQVTCSPSFIWMSLLQLEEDESELTIRFLKINYKRKRQAMEALSDAGFYDLETEEAVVDGKNKVIAKLSNIKQEFKSILPLIH